MEQKKKKISCLMGRDKILFILLFIWMIIPILKEIRFTYLSTVMYEYKFMELVGLVGIYCFSYEIYTKIINTKNKKDLIKEIAPLIILIIFLIWTFISCIYAKNKSNAFYGNQYRKEGYITYLIYAGFFSCAYLINSNKLKKYLLNTFIFIAFLNVLIISIANNNSNLAQYFFIQDIQKGIFLNQNHYGYYLLLVTMISCILFINDNNKYMKIFYGVVYVILAYNLILNNTFGCYVALIITIVLFLIYCLKQKKNRILCMSSLLIFILFSCFVRYNGENVVRTNLEKAMTDMENILEAIIISKDDILKENSDNINNVEEYINQKQEKLEDAGTGRVRLWGYGIKIFLEKPLLGYGIENLETEYAKYNIEQDRPHNFIIQLLITSGVIGFVLYTFGVGLILYRGLKKIETKNDNFAKDETININTILFFTVIAYFISALFGNSMYYTSPYLYILLGVLYGKTDKNKNL